MPIDGPWQKLFHAAMARAKYILCVGLTPALQETLEFARLKVREVNRCTTSTWSAAGKGTNVARVLGTLHARAVLLSFCGGDTGRVWLDDLARARIPAEIVRTRSTTRICQTLIDRSTGTVTELVREAPLPAQAEWRTFFRRFDGRLRHAQLVVIAGALMPRARETMYRDLVRRAREQGVPVVIDSQKAPLVKTLPQRPLLVKLNVHELENTLGRRLPGEKQIVAGARRLIDRGAQQVVVTHGAKGAWLVLPDRAWHFTLPRIRALNPIGSGDAATAGIASGIVKGWNIVEAVRLGVACGAANALTLTPGNVELHTVRKLTRKIRVRAV